MEEIIENTYLRYLLKRVFYIKIILVYLHKRKFNYGQGKKGLSIKAIVGYSG